jgi:ribonuclease HI
LVVQSAYLWFQFELLFRDRGAQSTSYDAETAGLAGGLGLAKDILTGSKHTDLSLPNIDRVLVCLDNQSAVHNIHRIHNSPGQKFSLLFRSHVRYITNVLGHSVELAWVKGHAGLRGNETADYYAREACRPRQMAGSLAWPVNVFGGTTLTWKKC